MSGGKKSGSKKTKLSPEVQYVVDLALEGELPSAGESIHGYYTLTSTSCLAVAIFLLGAGLSFIHLCVCYEDNMSTSEGLVYFGKGISWLVGAIILAASLNWLLAPYDKHLERVSKLYCALPEVDQSAFCSFITEHVKELQIQNQRKDAKELIDDDKNRDFV
jgi:hypothetical protein